MKLVIFGSRSFSQIDLVRNHLDEFTGVTEVVSGGARGADQLGELVAQERNIPVKIFPAEWDRYGKSAGYRRNEVMARYADQGLAFWDCQSCGTKNMIDLLQKGGKPCKVITFTKLS